MRKPATKKKAPQKYLTEPEFTNPFGLKVTLAAAVFEDS